MNRNEIWQAIELELRKDKKAHPAWPDHPAACAGIVVKEAGNLMNSCLEWKYNRNRSEIVKEVQQEYMRDKAIATAVKAIRFLENLK
jgi:hypothetical protein